MKTWNRTGLKSPLGQIPFFSKFMVNMRIKGRKKALEKLHNKIEKTLSDERLKVSKLVEAAERTDSHSIVQRAENLEDQLENVCPCKGTERGKGAQRISEEVRKACIEHANQVVGVSWKDGTGHYRDSKYQDWKKAMKECREKGTV